MKDKTDYGKFWANSTGPRTDAGKAVSSQNATKHGCCSDAKLIIAGESIEDYKKLEAAWLKAYKPNQDAEALLVKALVDAEWFLARANRVLAETEAAIFEAEPNPLKWTEDHHKALTRFQRYQTTRANAAAKARKAVEDYSKNRDTEVIRVQRHRVFMEKSKPEPTIDELIQQMMPEGVSVNDVVMPEVKPRTTEEILEEAYANGTLKRP